MDRFKQIKEIICRYAEADEAVMAVLCVRPSAKSVLPQKDTTLDMIIITDDPKKWYSGEYPTQFGNVTIAFLEPTIGKGKKYCVIYGEDKDVDMMIFTPEQFLETLMNGEARWLLKRGCDFMHDKTGFAGVVGGCLNTCRLGMVKLFCCCEGKNYRAGRQAKICRNGLRTLRSVSR